MSTKKKSVKKKPLQSFEGELDANEARNRLVQEIGKLKLDDIVLLLAGMPVKAKTSEDVVRQSLLDYLLESEGEAEAGPTLSDQVEDILGQNCFEAEVFEVASETPTSSWYTVTVTALDDMGTEPLCVSVFAPHPLVAMVQACAKHFKRGESEVFCDRNEWAKDTIVLPGQLDRIHPLRGRCV